MINSILYTVSFELQSLLEMGRTQRALFGWFSKGRSLVQKISLGRSASVSLPLDISAESPAGGSVCRLNLTGHQNGN